jgi:GT2 family glycosyltransferase
LPRNVLGVSRACLATRLQDFLAVGGFINGLGADLEGLDYCLKLAEQGRFTVHTPQAVLTMPRWRPPRPEAVTWHQQNWPRACARDPFYREDALATRPATQTVAMKVANL